ncbi:hypothetical protein [Nocardioides sp.]|uniref:hypothetical protein n=1 Tax=Nocardioides sp. TaxID=35761 RepID=UPI0026246FBF|nr:hypothetical protein [Nocardioides sp.]
MNTNTKRNRFAAVSAGIAVAAVAGWAIQSANAATDAGGQDHVVPDAISSLAPTSTSPVSGCPAGSAPELKVDRDPEETTGGAKTVLEAVQQLDPKVDAVSEEPFGRRAGAPIWVDAGGQTYLVTALEDDTWFASGASLAGCGLVSDMLTGIEK